MKKFMLKDTHGNMLFEMRVEDTPHDKFYGIKAELLLITGIMTHAYGHELVEPSYEYEHMAHLFIKWDLCSTWEFKGQDYLDGDIDSSYHICGSYAYRNFMQGMVFTVEVAKLLIGDAMDDEEYSKFKDMSDLLLKDCEIIEVEEVVKTDD